MKRSEAMTCPHYQSGSQPLCTKLDLVCRKCAGDTARCLTVIEAEEMRAYVDGQVAMLRGMKRVVDTIFGDSL